MICYFRRITSIRSNIVEIITDVDIYIYNVYNNLKISNYRVPLNQNNKAESHSNIYFRIYKNNFTASYFGFNFRFVMEHINGIEPAATNRITDGPLIKIPTGTYDTGEGFYQPFTNTVHDYWTNALLK